MDVAVYWKIALHVKLPVVDAVGVAVAPPDDVPAFIDQVPSATIFALGAYANTPLSAPYRTVISLVTDITFK